MIAQISKKGGIAVRAMTWMLLLAAVPLIATGCQKSATVENLTVTNDMIGNASDANAMTPTDDGMVNYAAPADIGDEPGNSGASK